ncbi:MAG: A/G-specific DNA-adenine glycosylase [Bacteroidetes bacterium]|nr:A/G-specific DNA-adenine glycosylase [Bacteroidota bacterium]
MHINSESIIGWYQRHKRDLPWRNTSDPYKIWISEIILQQTRVNQGLEYYLRFVDRFPDVKTLAAAELDEVLRYWQGLGYYSRARNLHKAACQINSMYNGVFPDDYQQILGLAGVGKYTAAAVSSLAFNAAYAVVDGNVYRVLSRLFGVDTPIDSTTGIKEFSELAQQFLDKSDPGMHNQALMEFGALQCVPVSPRCELCPVSAHCVAFKTDAVSQLPVKTTKVKVKNRFLNYLYIEYNGKTFIQRREENDIWKNLYEFPLIESDKLLATEELLSHPLFIEIFDGISEVVIVTTSAVRKHILTHRHIYATFTTIKINETNSYLSRLTKVANADLDRYAFSRLTMLFLEDRYKTLLE